MNDLLVSECKDGWMEEQTLLGGIIPGRNPGQDPVGSCRIL